MTPQDSTTTQHITALHGTGYLVELTAACCLPCHGPCRPTQPGIASPQLHQWRDENPAAPREDRVCQSEEDGRWVCCVWMDEWSCVRRVFSGRLQQSKQQQQQHKVFADALCTQVFQLADHSLSHTHSHPQTTKTAQLPSSSSPSSSHKTNKTKDARFSCFVCLVPSFSAGDSGRLTKAFLRPKAAYDTPHHTESLSTHSHTRTHHTAKRGGEGCWLLTRSTARKFFFLSVWIHVWWGSLDPQYTNFRVSSWKSPIRRFNCLNYEGDMSALWL